MLKTKLQDEIKVAMKAKDSLRLSTLKMLSSEIHNAEIDKGGDLAETEGLSIVKKEVKKRRDAIEAYTQAGRDDLARREESELEILQEFMPEQLSEEETGKVVDEVIVSLGASGMADMGKVIGAVISKIGDKADGAVVSKITKQKLSS